MNKLRHDRQLVYIQTGDEPSVQDPLFCVFTGDENLASARAAHHVMTMNAYEAGALVMRQTITRIGVTPPARSDSQPDADQGPA